MRLSRVFWFGAAAILIVAALVAISAILRGDAGETDWKILGTLLSLLVAGATAVSGLALVERNVSPALGWAAAAGAALCFLVQAAAIWDEFSNDDLGKWAASSIALLLALLLVVTQRLLLRDERLLLLFYGTATAAVLAASLTSFAIWDESDDLWQTVAVFSVLAVLGYFLLPVVQRLSRSEAPAVRDGIRVLGSLDGVELVAARGPVDGIAIEPPSAGERLVLRRRG
jgi:hypothetical protein